MKSKDVVKQLIPGIVMGIVLGTVIGFLVGVDKENVMKNNIGGLMACLIPCLLNCTIVVKGTAKVLKRKLSVLKAFTGSLLEIIIGAIIGFLFHLVVLGKLLHLNTCDFTKVQMTVINMVLGVVVSTLMAYIALRKYEKRVKYTKR